MLSYQERIRAALIGAGIDCPDVAAVEAFMRLDSQTGSTRTLDGMSAAMFVREAVLCARAVNADLAEARAFADTMGL